MGEREGRGARDGWFWCSVTLDFGSMWVGGGGWRGGGVCDAATAAPCVCVSRFVVLTFGCLPIRS
jgi:hypothetical protein